MRTTSDPAGWTRRAFLRVTGQGTLALWTTNALGIERRLWESAAPAGTLAPGTIPKFVTDLVIPPAMPRSGPDAYRIAMRQFAQQLLPPPLPPTTVWGYGSATDPATFHSPACTIEVAAGTPVTVTWINGLVDERGHFLPHLLAVDPTLHWANPPGGEHGRDTRPVFTSTPGRYTGPVPIVTHVHGMAQALDWSDGYAEAWYLPDATDIPAGYAETGRWYEFFRQKGRGDWGRGRATFLYPNSQRPSTAWYHDHTLGITRVNVYAGGAGFYLVRSTDPREHPTDSATGGAAVLPGPAPQLDDAPGTRYHEIPLAIQDRSFGRDGALFYPDARASFDDFAGPFTPASDVPPIWHPEFFGDCMMVNGRTWPRLDVEPRRYRFRLLNGCQARTLILAPSDARVEMWQVGSEGGFLARPVRLGRIVLAPAERADVIVDFARVPAGQRVTLRNLGPDGPFAGADFKPADPKGTGLVMQFRVRAAPAGFEDPTTPPARLRMPAIEALPAPVRTRPLALLEHMAEPPARPVPAELRLGTFDPVAGAPDGIVGRTWAEPVTENPGIGDVEDWEFYNFTMDSHPMHLHEVFFQVVNRQPLDRITGRPIRAPRAPEPWEAGWKDTVTCHPGEVTRVRMRFTNTGQFVWHCHIVEHEDNEMMRPFRIGPVQPGQPADVGHR